METVGTLKGSLARNLKEGLFTEMAPIPQPDISALSGSVLANPAARGPSGPPSPTSLLASTKIPTASLRRLEGGLKLNSRRLLAVRGPGRRGEASA